MGMPMVHALEAHTLEAPVLKVLTLEALAAVQILRAPPSMGRSSSLQRRITLICGIKGL